MHKFYLGQGVEYHPPRGTYVPAGTWVITVKLPERNGECYYRVRRASEIHERVVREGELSAIPNLTAISHGEASVTDEPPKAPTKLNVTERAPHKV